MIRKAQFFIYENVYESLSINEVCNYINISESYFSRVFKNEVKVTPYTFILRTKVEKAKELLSKGEDISQVALKIGFTDQSHFNRVFKKFVSLTPNQYKQKEIICK
jgi:two-component system response regulator YesN